MSTNNRVGDRDHADKRSELHDVTAIYLDSEPISAGKGFTLSAETRQMLEHARGLHVELNVPEPVVIELQLQFERELGRARDSARDACKLVAAIDGRTYEAPSFDEKGAASRHMSKMRVFLDTFNIKAVPFTTRSHEDLFRMACRRQKPFRESGKGVTDAGFKDAVVYLSVADHVRANGKSAAFVSDDTDYKYGGAEGILEVGVRLARTTTADMISELKRRLDARERDAAEARRLLADHDLHQSAPQLQDIETFVRQNFVLPDLYQLPVQSSRHVHSVNVRRVEVRYLVPTTDVAPGEQVALTIYMLVRLDLLVHPRSLWRADEGDDPEIHSIDVVATVEVTAVRTSDGYRDFHPVSMNVPTGLLSATKHHKRAGDAWVKELRERGETE